MDIEKILGRFNLLFTILAAAFALFLSFRFSTVEKGLSVQATEIANNKALIELEQSQARFGREFKLNLLKELNTALNTTKKDTLYCAIAVAFVRDMLADDPFKSNIMQVFEHSAFVPKNLRERIAKENIEEQKFTLKNEELELSMKSSVATITEKQIRIDIFYLENQSNNTNQSSAEKIADKLNKVAGYKATVRLLPASVNLRSGYKVSNNEIRYDSDETELALKLQETLNKESSLNFQTRLSSSQTKNYISLFVAATAL